jgi:DNA-binding transcriptional LysR family regulator
LVSQAVPVRCGVDLGVAGAGSVAQAALRQDIMNIHHLELFYFVARHGGITEAVRNIPYGIQQPAVSGQVAQLEEFLGVTLFQRRPFALTAAGEKLYQFIQPFFASLDQVAGELQGGKAHHIRIGASTIVLRDHLPEVCQTVRQRFPNLKISLREGYPQDFENLLQKGELDLAVTTIEKKPAQGLRSVSLIEVPLVLLVHKGSKVTAADQLWKRDKIEEPLICLPPAEAVCKNFQQGLSRRGVDWFPGMEVSSLELIETYVANGFGIGLSVQVPRSKTSPSVRTLPLPDFAPVVLGVMWRGKTSALLQAFLDEMQLRAKRIPAGSVAGS